MIDYKKDIGSLKAEVEKYCKRQKINRMLISGFSAFITIILLKLIKG